jgi:hypothetical protein
MKYKQNDKFLDSYARFYAALHWEYQPQEYIQVDGQSGRNKEIVLFLQKCRFSFGEYVYSIRVNFLYNLQKSSHNNYLILK